MSTTPRDIIAASLRKFGALASGETASAAAQSDAIAELNRMVAAWSVDKLTCVAKVRETFTLTAGTKTYTWSSTVSSPNFISARPVEVEAALIQIAGTSPLVEIPMNIITMEEYAAITAKDVSSSIPTHLYIEGTNPNETLNFWPSPNAANVFVAYSRKPILAAITDASTTVDLPPGWEDALVTNLAVRLCPEYGKAVTPDLAAQAIESKAVVARFNIKPTYMACDPAAMGGSGKRGFNILAGDR